MCSRGCGSGDPKEREADTTDEGSQQQNETGIGTASNKREIKFHLVGHNIL